MTSTTADTLGSIADYGGEALPAALHHVACAMGELDTFGCGLHDHHLSSVTMQIHRTLYEQNRKLAVLWADHQVASGDDDAPTGQAPTEVPVPAMDKY